MAIDRILKNPFALSLALLVGACIEPRGREQQDSAAIRESESGDEDSSATTVEAWATGDAFDDGMDKEAEPGGTGSGAIPLPSETTSLPADDATTSSLPPGTTSTGSSSTTGGPPDEGTPSAGCGGSSRGSGEFETRTIAIDDVERTFHVLVPESYDPEHPYPIVFRWHGTGGDGLSGGLGIEFSSDEEAIIVGANGLDEEWSNANQANDLALFDTMLDELSFEYCIDRDRVFSYGFSAGAGFTNLLACVRGDVVRANAAIAGFHRGTNCVGSPAAWMLHDEDDRTVLIEYGLDVLERRLAINGCTDQTVPEANASCVRYEGCAEPVVWCQSSGLGHTIQGSFAPPLVWDFFSEFLP